MSVRDIHKALASLTPQQRALFARRLEESGWSGGVQEILPRPATGAPVVTSLMQQRLWILGELEPGNPFYNLPILCFRLTGRLRHAALVRCFREIERRHESLRTVFTHGDPFPLQVIRPAGERAFPLIDLSALPAERREETAWEIAREEGRLPFDLAEGPLWRTSLLRLAAGDENAGGDHLLLVTMHHIISDAWSLGVFYRELGVLYAAFARSVLSIPSPLPEPPIQYADFALWQRRQLQGERLAEEIGFWREQLAGAPDLLELPTDRPRPAPRTYDGERLTTWFSPALAEGIAALSARAGASLYMTLLAAFATVLHRWTGQDDIVLGAPVAGRTHVATEGLIGFFVNTVAFRVRLHGDAGGEPAFREVVARTRNAVLDVYEHQELPFDKLVEELNPRRNPAYSPVFQAMISLQNTPTPDLELPGLEVTALGINTGTSQTDLIVFAGMERGRLGLLHLEFNTDLFDQATMQRMEGHLLRLLAGAVADPEQRLSLLPMLSPAEEHQLLHEDSERHPEGGTLHELFAAQAQQRPDAVALTSDSLSLTYAELERRANALAHHLRAMGIEPEARVGLCVERGPEMLIGLLGILKAGGAYVPLDPSYPSERLAFLVDDALGGQESPVVLAGEGLAGRLSRYGAQTVELSAGFLAGEADHPPPNRSLPDHPAYVIYTSGSTGRPKGVINTHASVAGFLASSWERFAVTAKDVWPLFHSFVFDFSVWEIFGPLLSGGRLVVVPREVVRSPRGFLRLLATAGVTVINQTPAAIYQLAAALDDQEDGDALLPAAVRLVMAGGDVLDLRRLAVWRARQGDRPRLANVYGITETTVLSTSRWTEGRIEREELEAGPRIGRPLSGVDVHLLGPRGEMVPLGVHGEVHLGGAGLARGYLGRPDLTAERFIPDPFSTQPGARLYKSGDLARRCPDGDLESLGRIDRQVKVRGFRIELGEIEAALARHPGVRECAAAVREVAPGDPGIAAWYVPASGSAPEPAALRSFLEQSLPAHMIPAAFTPLAALPWNASGKIDRKALPAPERAGSAAGATENAAPCTPLEESLAEMWRDLLGIERVGRDDDFFALGGHSLLATRLISRLRDRLQVEVPPQLVFQTPRLAALAHALEHVREASVQPQAPALTAIPRRARRAV